MMVGAIVQARMGSTRLPGKALLDIDGLSMLARVVDRARRAQRVDCIVVAAPSTSGDDELAAHAAALGVDVYRGDEHDVLDRYYQAAKLHQLNVVVRVTSDCPLLDPGVLDAVVDLLVAPGSRVEYAASTLVRTYPRGLDVEAVPFPVLERVWREARSPHERAHVFPYIHEHTGRFVTAGISEPIDRSHMRWTVDTEDDLAFVRAVCRALGTLEFTWRDVLKVLDANPELVRINALIRQKSAYDL
jgi:spore coat polysaccharide biosynthesis protein SpsF (cytidylyltransferase family)